MNGKSNDLRFNAAMRRIDGWYLAANAVVVGDVQIGKDSSIWYGSVLRGDDDSIVLGERVNIQDLTMVHADPGVPLILEDDITVGHRAVVHCHRVGSGTLIGMGAILMKGVVIGEQCLVAAGSVVPPGANIAAGSLVRGVPGKVVRPLTAEEKADCLLAAQKYVESARDCVEWNKSGSLDLEGSAEDA